MTGPPRNVLSTDDCSNGIEWPNGKEVDRRGSVTRFYYLRNIFFDRKITFNEATQFCSLRESLHVRVKLNFKSRWLKNQIFEEFYETRQKFLDRIFSIK